MHAACASTAVHLWMFFDTFWGDYCSPLQLTACFSHQAKHVTTPTDGNSGKIGEEYIGDGHFVPIREAGLHIRRCILG